MTKLVSVFVWSFACYCCRHLQGSALKILQPEVLCFPKISSEDVVINFCVSCTRNLKSRCRLSSVVVSPCASVCAFSKWSHSFFYVSIFLSVLFLLHSFYLILIPLCPFVSPVLPFDTRIWCYYVSVPPLNFLSPCSSIVAFLCLSECKSVAICTSWTSV